MSSRRRTNAPSVPPPSRERIRRTVAEIDSPAWRVDHPTGVELMTDLSAAAWIEEGLAEWPDPFIFPVGCAIPEGFTAYARMFHPIRRHADEEEVRQRWADFAAERGKVAHAACSSRASSGPSIGSASPGPRWPLTGEDFPRTSAGACRRSSGRSRRLPTPVGSACGMAAGIATGWTIACGRNAFPLGSTREAVAGLGGQGGSAGGGARSGAARAHVVEQESNRIGSPAVTTCCSEGLLEAITEFRVRAIDRSNRPTSGGPTTGAGAWRRRSTGSRRSSGAPSRSSTPSFTRRTSRRSASIPRRGSISAQMP